MSNSYFQFKQFTIHQDRCAMKVTTDACLFGAWAVKQIDNEELLLTNSLDIGTGTGLLSLILAQKVSLNIDTIEIDKDSYEQAKENIKASPWSNRVNIYFGDARSFEFKNRYDIIISNPPFFENELKSGDQKRNIALHSHELTLEDLLKVMHRNLSQDGIFFLLLPYKRQEEVMKIFKKYAFDLKQIIFVRQSVKHDYFRMMVKGRRKISEMMETHFEEISIRNEKKEYTREFVALLKDYYLYL